MTLIAALCLPVLAQQESPTVLPSQSIVKVVAHSNCSFSSGGSGVVVAPGIVLTSAHVVQGTDSVKVVVRGTTYFASAHILAPEVDLCLLRVPSLLAPPVLLAEDSAIVENMKVEAIGFPRGLGPIATSGTVTGKWRFRGSLLVQSNATIHPGSSGGGLFAEDGRLLGITTFVILSYEGLGFFLPSSWIPELLRRPWQQGGRIALCRSKESVLQDFLEGMIEDPSNRPAWEAYSRAWVASCPKVSDAWYSLGYTLSQRASEEAPSSTNALSIREAARQAYLKALALNPGLARAWNNLGVIQDDLGESEAAVVSFRTAVQLLDSFGLAWLNLGGACLNTRSYGEAAKALRQGLALIPDDAEAWARLGYCEGKLGQSEAAIRHLRMALALRPMRMEWWLDLVQICRRGNRMDAFEVALRFIRERLPSLASEISLRVKASVP